MAIVDGGYDRLRSNIVSSQSTAVSFQFTPQNNGKGDSASRECFLLFCFVAVVVVVVVVFVLVGFFWTLMTSCGLLVILLDNVRASKSLSYWV